MEADLGTRLDWVAADHWNIDNSHVHLLVRGADEAGVDLVNSRQMPRLEWSERLSVPEKTGPICINIWPPSSQLHMGPVSSLKAV